jgi:hypothetical protein
MKTGLFFSEGGMARNISDRSFLKKPIGLLFAQYIARLKFPLFQSLYGVPNQKSCTIRIVPVTVPSLRVPL